MKKKISMFLISAFALMAFPAGTAFAWTFGLTGNGVCEPNGSYKITWTVDNTTESETLRITASSNTGVVPVGTEVAADSKEDFAQIVSGTTPGTFNLTLQGDWPSDSTDRTRTATVTLTQPCGGMGGGEEDKVTLCHGTGSNTNPYEKITIDNSGAYNGHYSVHQGSIYPGNGGSWGDIIPPFTFEENTYQMNWDTAGQTIYRNDCKLVVGGMGGGSVTTVTAAATTTPPPTGGRGAAQPQVQAPVGGVNAGFGNSPNQVNIVSLMGLISSMAVAGLGMRRLSSLES
jgi:hypothetical protein